MRLLTKELQDAIKSAENFSYYFDITLKHGDRFFLTSFDKSDHIEGRTYNPNCGLRLKEAIFDDSGKDQIILEGIFDEDFISRKIDLTGSKIKISLRFKDFLYHFVTYTCTIYTKTDLNFTIYLAPETIKYDKSLLNMFSKTCRADFGDDKCKIDKNAHKEIAQIINIDLNIVRIDTSQFKARYENGHFTGGDAIFGGVFRSKIYRHFDDIIEVNDIVPSSIKHHKTIELITGCDKNFITCCNKFNNAVNFRGEPYIKDGNFLQN